jgi:hypothetical protein
VHKETTIPSLLDERIFRKVLFKMGGRGRFMNESCIRVHIIYTAEKYFSILWNLE